MADPEWHWADPIVLNSNRHQPSIELRLSMESGQTLCANEIKYESLVGPGYIYGVVEVKLKKPSSFIHI